MESRVNGVSSSFKNINPAPIIAPKSPPASGTSRRSRNPSPKPSRKEGVSPNSPVKSKNHGIKVVRSPRCNVQKHPKVAAAAAAANKNKGNESLETAASKNVSAMETKSNMKHPVDDYAGSVKPKAKNNIATRGISGSLYASAQFSEVTESFSLNEVSEGESSAAESGEVSFSIFVNHKSPIIRRGSTSSDISDESSASSHSTIYKPHQGNDTRWEAIQAVKSRMGAVELKDFRLLRRLGCGDIGSVYLSELISTDTYFAMKVMDKASLASRKKLLRADTEREILQLLDHPFLPTLYTHFETDNHSCLVMEFCPGGDLHSLRQKQPRKYFPENAARFYVAEVLLALEYLHMIGIIYRDLKPENVLVREDGHIMLSDFDLSLRCASSPTLVKATNSRAACIEPMIQPDCIQPRCFGPRFLSSKKKKEIKKNIEANHLGKPLELIAEPTSARSMSFVGTHEYLAPEIIRGEGHGSAVDWWTLGIFLYELLFGKTPFKGAGNRATLFNVVGQPLRFPEHPTVSFAARDLIRGLLVKEPQKRLAYKRGATEIKQHPFFQGVNWALIRCANPPDVPKQVMSNAGARTDTGNVPSVDKVPKVDVNPSDSYFEIDFF